MKKHLYRLIAMLTAMLMLTVLLFGCGADDDPDWWTAEPTETTETETTTTTEPEPLCSYVCECEDPDDCDYECFCLVDNDNDNDDYTLQLIAPTTTSTTRTTVTTTTTTTRVAAPTVTTTTTTTTTRAAAPTTPPPGVVPVTGVNFTGSSATPYTLQAGQAQQQLNFAVQPANATQNVNFRSSNGQVLQVSPAGQMRPQSGGTATVEAFVGHTVFATVTVTVRPAVIVHAPAASVAVGSTLALNARDFNGAQHPAANITWSSNATNFATVDPATGVVTAVRARDNPVIITATLQHESGTITGVTAIMITP